MAMCYELIYPNNDKTKPPYGFMLYVDKNGDDKPDYKFKYILSNVGHYYTLDIIIQELILILS